MNFGIRRERASILANFMTMNRVCLVCRIGNEPYLKDINRPKATKVCRFSCITNEIFYSEGEERKPHPQHHQISIWGRQGEVLAKYLKKGMLVAIDGKLKYWYFQLGNMKRKQKISEIHADEVIILSKKGDFDKPEEPEEKPIEREPGEDDVPDDEEPCPF